MPAPFIVNSREGRDSVLAQRGVPDVMSMARSADLKTVGIGAVGPHAQMVPMGIISANAIKDNRHAGGVVKLIERL